MIASTAMTDAQKKLIHSQIEKNGMHPSEIEARLGFAIQDLSKQEASNLIDCFMKNGDLDEAVNKIREARNESDAATKEEEAQEATQAVTKNVKNPMNVEKPSSRPQLMAKLNGIPQELADMYFAIIDGALYIKNPGLLYMASKKGYAKIESTSQSDGKGGYIALAKVYPKIPIDFIKAIASLSPDLQVRLLDEQYGPTVEKGSANKDNVKNTRMHPFFEELARTRAVDRALRLYTGYGGTSYEELPDAEVGGGVQ